MRGFESLIKRWATYGLAGKPLAAAPQNFKFDQIRSFFVLHFHLYQGQKKIRLFDIILQYIPININQHWKFKQQLNMIWWSRPKTNKTKTNSPNWAANKHSLTTEYDELLPAPVAVKGHWNSVRLGSFRGCGSNQFLPEPQRLAQCKRSTGAWCKTCNPNPGWGNPLLRELWTDGHLSRVLVHNIPQVFVELLLIYLSANCQPFLETLWNSGALTLGKDCRTVGSVLAMIGLSIFELFQLCQRAVHVPWIWEKRAFTSISARGNRSTGCTFRPFPSFPQMPFFPTNQEIVMTYIDIIYIHIFCRCKYIYIILYSYVYIS